MATAYTKVSGTKSDDDDKNNGSRDHDFNICSHSLILTLTQYYSKYLKKGTFH